MKEVDTYVDGQDQVDKVLSGEVRWMSRSCTSEIAAETCSTTDSSLKDSLKRSENDTYSDKNSSSGSEWSELAIHTFLMENPARHFERELYQDPDSDCYLFSSEKVFDNAADDLEMIVVSKRSMSLLRQKEAVRNDLEPFKQETKPFAKIWCDNMEDSVH